VSVETENIEILKRAYRDWESTKGAGTHELENLFDKNLRFTSLANAADKAVAFTAPRQGKDDFMSYLDGLTSDWEMLFYRVDEYIAQGERVVAIGSTSWRNKATRKIVTTPKVDVWRMKNRKAVELAEYYDTAQLIAAAKP
jgi:ketosteroid isomerase-like protein